MLLESILFGGGLLFLARFHQALLSIESDSLVGKIQPTLGNVVAYLGAGVYEELIFRMIALSVLVAIIKSCGCSTKTSWCLSVSLSSVAFAAAHYQFQFGAVGSEWMSSGFDGFVWSTFVFRFSAGVLFCLLFLFRGFGIAVGAHALYDILVGC
jgi:membrane protease YdiL (CAAX protease family)